MPKLIDKIATKTGQKSNLASIWRNSNKINKSIAWTPALERKIAVTKKINNKIKNNLQISIEESVLELAKIKLKMLRKREIEVEISSPDQRKISRKISVEVKIEIEGQGQIPIPGLGIWVRVRIQIPISQCLLQYQQLGILGYNGAYW